jgi:NAD(P)-dependent dehydrogenase (short-subunit alcohol dehydrogenase family)
LHETGYRVIVTGQDPERVAAAADELPEGITAVKSDSRSVSDLDALAQQITVEFGRLDTVLLNAGAFVPLPFELATDQDIVDSSATNAEGTLFTLRRVLPLVDDGGSIVFTVGLGATRGGVGGSLGSASRGALLAIVPTLAVELAPRQIRVNAVSPGAVATPLWTKMGLPNEVMAQMSEGLIAKIPLARIADAEDIAHVVTFLASPESAYITGQNLVVAGGLDIAL